MPDPTPAPLRGRIVVAAICAVLVVAGGIALHASSFDLPLDVALNRLHHGLLGTVGDVAYKALGPVPAIIETVVLTVVILLVRRDLRLASTFAATIAITWLPTVLIKIAIGRPRPDIHSLSHPPVLQTDASYPSGHMVFTTVLVVAAILLTRSVVLRRVWIVVGVLGLLGFAFCLMSDGVHFPTDVLASVIWSIGVGPLVAALWSRFVARRLPERRRGRRRALA